LGQNNPLGRREELVIGVIFQPEVFENNFPRITGGSPYREGVFPINGIIDSLLIRGIRRSRYFILPLLKIPQAVLGDR